MWPKPMKFVRGGKEQQQWALPKDNYKEELCLYSETNEYKALYMCSQGDWVFIKSGTIHFLLPIFFLMFLFDPLSNDLSFHYIPLLPSHLHHPFLPNFPLFLTLVTFHI